MSISPDGLRLKASVLLGLSLCLLIPQCLADDTISPWRHITKYAPTLLSPFGGPNRVMAQSNSRAKVRQLSTPGLPDEFGLTKSIFCPCVHPTDFTHTITLAGPEVDWSSLITLNASTSVEKPFTNATPATPAVALASTLTSDGNTSWPTMRASRLRTQLGEEWVFCLAMSSAVAAALLMS